MMQELNYIRCGDYYIPDIRLPEENRPIGRWGRMHRDYIKEHNPIRFNDLCLSGKLWTYLADLNKQVQSRLELVIEQKSTKFEKERKKCMPTFKTIRQVAVLGILSEHRLRIMVAAGQCPGIQTGNRFLINVDALSDILEKQSRKAIVEGAIMVEGRRQPGVMLYLDFWSGLKRLSYEEKGRLVDGIMAYAEDGTEPNFDGALAIVWDIAKLRVDSDTEQYLAKCDRQRERALKRWGNTVDATGCHGTSGNAEGADDANSTQTNSTQLSNRREGVGGGQAAAPPLYSSESGGSSELLQGAWKLRRRRAICRLLCGKRVARRKEQDERLACSRENLGMLTRTVLPTQLQQGVEEAAGGVLTTLTSQTGDFCSAEWWAAAFNSLARTKQTSAEVCPTCHGKGLIASVIEREGMQYRAVRPCDCQAHLRTLRAAERSGLGTLLRRYRLDNYETSRPWQADAVLKAKGFIQKPRGWFTICGTPGTGKTHLCAAICGELINAGRDVKYFQWREHGPKLKSLLGEYRDYEREMNSFKRVGVLYIDDFMRGSVTEGDKNLAFELLNDRYLTERPTIISSERCIRELLDIDEGIGSRIAEMSRGFYVETPPENRRVRRGA